MKTWTKEEKYRYLKDPQELNDPNGFVWHDNKWHLFYQWCPWGAVHGLKHWYHIVSKDLVTWKNLGVCLLPDQEEGYDNKGVYSGSAMPIGDKIYLYYTGNHRDADWTRHAYTCLARPATPIPVWPGWAMTDGRKNIPCPCSAPIPTIPSIRETPRSSVSPAGIPTT